ncbi:LOW QUALITY PROTEIN: hypothetical protein U9M48_029851 [Paspalum notatum var. saurae]|uniref:Uncharacterized protein n=1 Tax=Paspalum notatum var. saurae TaxID=547442 RepID=A0AAQ3X215_PASNO
MGSRVRALSVTHVRPAKASNPLPQDAAGDHAIKLSLFDTLFIALTPMQRLFFYEGDGLPPFPALLATLRSSLAATLAVFAPLAGKLAVSPSGDDAVVVIDCSPGTVSQGVRFVEAEYAGGAADMRRLASAAEHDGEAYAQLAPALAVSALPAPALAVQVTRPAADTGRRRRVVVVGVSVNHAVADGQALWVFIRAWAAAARAGSSPSPAWPPAGFVPPTFDRAAINGHPKAEEVARKFLRVFAPDLPTVSSSVMHVSRRHRVHLQISGARGCELEQCFPRGYVQHAATCTLARHRLAPQIITSACEQVNTFPVPDNTLQGRRTYLLSASQITSLKQRIVSQQSNRAAADVKPPTTYAAVASLVWTSGVRAKNGQSDAGADAYLMFAADCRARLRPPMPGAFFGNCAKACYARATVGELWDGGAGALARAAAAVHEAVREQLEEPLADAERWLERHRAIPPDRFLQIGSSNRFAAYDTDFGWGRPSSVELATVFVREFVAVVGAPDGAVQVSVALDRGRIHDFETNFLSHYPCAPSPRSNRHVLTRSAPR